MKLYAQIKISGDAKLIAGVITFQNPKIEKGHHYLDCKIMSFDIETGKDGRLYSLAYSFCSLGVLEEKIFMLGPQLSLF